MDILILIFFVLFLLKLNFNKNDEAYLSKEYTVYLRGILALLVVFAHISYGRTYLPVFKVFTYIGPIVVAIFFFLSGYGLIFQYRNKGNEEYLKGYMYKRVLKLCSKYVCIWLLYFFILMFQFRFDFGLIINSNIDLLIPHSWFILIIIIYYTLFYIFGKIFKNNISLISRSILLSTIIMFFIMMALKMDNYWCISVFSFWLGIEYCQKFSIKYKNNNWIIAITLALFFIFEVAQILVGKYIGILWIKYLIQNIANMMATICFINIGKFIRFNNLTFKFCGEISLEIYLIHGIFEQIYKNIDLINNNNLLYGFSIIFSTIILSKIYNKIFNFIDEKERKKCQKKN